MTHLLNRPAYSALISSQSHLAQTNGSAMAFKPDFAAFAAFDGAPAFDGLAQLEIGPDGFWFLEPKLIEAGNGFYVDKTAHCVQMIYDHEVVIEHDVRTEILTQNDAQEIYDLAIAQKPGPFFKRTNELYEFIGIKDKGKLVAMMGERLQVGQFSEISALATYPEYQNRGWGKYLMNLVTRRVVARGQIPFLHVYAWNEKGIKLYESLGFKCRTDVYVTVLKKT